MRTAYCFDLDGTLTKEEILPLLSREIDLFEEMSALTDATIQGIIPFKKSFLLRCRLLSEIEISRVNEIISGVSLYSAIIEFIKNKNEDCYVITGNLDVWIKDLIDIIGCSVYCSKGEVVNNKLIKVISVLGKDEAIKELRKTYDKIVVVGDGMGDVAMFEEADVRIAFGGTHNPIQTLIQNSDFITYEENALCRLLNTL